MLFSLQKVDKLKELSVHYKTGFWPTNQPIK